jgi:hypothetical protein
MGFGKSLNIIALIASDAGKEVHGSAAYQGSTTSKEPRTTLLVVPSTCELHIAFIGIRS